MSLAVMKFILNGSSHIVALHTHTHTHKQRVVVMGSGLDDFPTSTLMGSILDGFPTSTWCDHDKQITHD